MTHTELFTVQLLVLLVQAGGMWVLFRKLKPEIAKTKAEEQSALGEAVEGAGQTLANAWKRIGDLENWKTEAQKEIEALKNSLETMRGKYLSLWRYLIDVIKDARGKGIKQLPAPPREIANDPELMELLTDTKDRMKPVEVVK